MSRALFFLLFAGAISSVAAEQKTLHGHVPAAAAQLRPAGRLAASNTLDLAIGLPLRNQTALTNLLHELYDPASPRFHQFLTPDQFTAQFGPAEEDYQAVIAFARSNHLTVTATHLNRVVLDITGAAGDVEKAFGVKLQVYRHPLEGRTFYAPESEPSVPVQLAVLDISGMDNYLIPHPMSLRQPAPNAARPQAGNGSAPGGNYMGYDFRAAYAPGVTNTGSGQIVGLLEYDGYHASDIALYESTAGLPSVPLQNVLLDRVRGNAGSANSEVALDIEMAISMAPGLTKVIIYEGTRGNDILSRMATDNTARQLSSSWTFGINATTEQLYQQMVSQGQAMFQASGDSGAYTGAISPPADDPNVTSVGGTRLATTGPQGAWVSEKVWNWYPGQAAASSGGISTVYTIPSWQQGISMSVNSGSTTMRNIPDVALTGDNVWVIYSNGSAAEFGGTSCAAPLWAGFMALMNQQAASNGKPPIGFLNPTIYALGKGPNYLTTLHDITTGNNTTPSSPNNFFAVPGFDLCAGWGTPMGKSTISLLAGTPTLPPVFTSNPFSESRANAGQAYAGSIATNATDPNTGATLSFSKVSGPAWLSVSGTGTLSGTPASSNTGTNTFSVRVVDSLGMSNSATMYVYVNGAPSFTANPFSKPGVVAGQSYAASIATNATDPNPGNTLTFSKVSGGAWLSVAANGGLSGMPLSSDAGTNSFVVSVTDSGGLSNSATMLIAVAPAAPIVAGLSIQGASLLLSWNGGIGPYQVQTTTNLASNLWANVGGASSTNQLVVSPAGNAAFYRIGGR